MRIAEDETSTSITVMAVSALDETKRGEATVDISEGPIVSVSITPSDLVVEKGGTYSFNAIVTGANASPEDIDWKVEGGNGKTAITQDGSLYVDTNEDATMLSVTATVNLDIASSRTIYVPLTLEIVKVNFLGNEPRGRIPGNNGVPYFAGGEEKVIEDVKEWADYIKRQDAAVILFGCIAKLDSSANEGYASGVDLGQKRADAVKELLVSHYGISPEKIITKGLGYDTPWHKDNGINGTTSWNEEAAKQNRIVAIYPADDPYAKMVLEGNWRNG